MSTFGLMLVLAFGPLGWSFPWWLWCVAYCGIFVRMEPLTEINKSILILAKQTKATMERVSRTT